MSTSDAREGVAPAAPTTPSELISRLEDVAQSFTELQGGLAEFARSIPRSDRRIWGSDESGLVRVEISGRLRITAVDIDDAATEQPLTEAGEKRLARANDGQAPRSQNILQGRLMLAYWAAVERAFDPDSGGGDADAAEVPTGTGPQGAGAAAAEADTEAVPDVYEFLDEVDRWSTQRLAELTQNMAAQAEYRGHDSERRIAVCVTGSGVVKSIEVDQRWASSCRGRIIAEAVMEAVADAWGQAESHIEVNDV